MCNGEEGKYVKISMEIEIRPDQPDQNHVRYTEKALQEMAESAAGQPIVFKDGGNSFFGEQVIGKVDSASYDGKSFKINGIMFGGGTNENILLFDGEEGNIVVSSAKVFSVGFSLPYEYQEERDEPINTIQKRNNLNVVFRCGDPGPGGAYHKYLIIGKYNGRTIAEIHFQKGPRGNPLSKTGLLDVDLLEIVRDRLSCFQKGDMLTREAAIALTHVEEALLWLNKRTEDRAERNVLGTMEK